ncbi:MAG: DNA primase, partial [Bacteroidales bacterium]
NEHGRAIGLSYFRERKFSEATIRKFGLGYAVGNSAPFTDSALKKGYKKEYLVGTGLTVERDNGDLADRFYERVMFPIQSVSGRVIAFGGRTLRTDKSIAKYVNSPETEIYNKSRSLYGIYFAKSAIAKNDKCYLVEGYTDVISMHQSGIENVVASSGTSLTVEQIRLIKRFTDKITIIYDGDAAGIKASIRGIDLVLEAGMFVKVVLLPPEDDPDSFAKAHTKDEIEDYISREECDFITYKSELLSKDMANDPLKKAQLINDIISSVAVIQDPVLRNVYVEMVSERFDQKIDTVLQKIKELRAKKKRWQKSSEEMIGSQQEAQQLPAGEEYIPASEEAAGDASFGASQYAISNTFLSVPEKELIYYIIKFGCYPIHFEENMIYGAAKKEEVSVVRYIVSALEEDGLEFSNQLYKEIYEQAVAYIATLTDSDCEQNQKLVVRRFSTDENQQIAQTVMDMLCESHPLTVKGYLEAIVPEDQMLGITVPKAVILYRLRYTEQACNVTARQIAEAAKEGDTQRQFELLKTLQMLNKVKNAFTQELNKY